MRLLIVSHTPHYRHPNGKLVGWGPTIVEIDQLSQLFSEVVHLAPLHTSAPPPSALPYTSPKVRFEDVPPTGGETLRSQLDILAKSRVYLRKLVQLSRQADALHVRCPANISLMTLLWMTFSNRPAYRWVKYAGNWRPEQPTARSYTLQRFWLNQGWHRGMVTINGRWPNQPPHVTSFYNPSLTDDWVTEGRRVGQEKTLTQPLQLLYAGTVDRSKGVDRVLEIARAINGAKVDFELNILGDGPERAGFEAWASSQGLARWVHFRGWLPKPELASYYTHAHLLLHPTLSDGWPKVLSEAMAYGVVPLAGAVSSIPQVLAQTGAGFALPPMNVNAYAAKILEFAAQPGLWKHASQAGLSHAPLFTYENYLQSVRDMFSQAWNVKL